MSKHLHTLRLSLYGIFVLLAMLVLVDFIFPGKVLNNEIVEVNIKRQNYYNAARGYHYTYKVITEKHQFYVTEDFAESVEDHAKIEYSISRIFKEINWYRSPSSENQDIYTLRIISGLVIPLLAILSIFIAYRSKKDIDTIVFLLQLLLIVNVVYLIM